MREMGFARASAHTRTPHVLCFAQIGNWPGQVREESACRWCGGGVAPKGFAKVTTKRASRETCLFGVHTQRICHYEINACRSIPTFRDGCMLCSKVVGGGRMHAAGMRLLGFRREPYTSFGFGLRIGPIAMMYHKTDMAHAKHMTTKSRGIASRNRSALVFACGGPNPGHGRTPSDSGGLCYTSV